MGNWLIRFAKGAVIGFGAIMPGLSGGVMAVIFGVYDPLLKFLADIRVQFVKNLLYFFPLVAGCFAGVVIFSFAVKQAFLTAPALFICLFIGFVAGTFPSLYRSAGAQGRSLKDKAAFLVAGSLIFALMMAGESQLFDIEPNFFVWLASGALIGLGLIVPGLSPSNFLIYFGLYDKMASRIAALDFMVIIPLCAGMAASVLLLAKLVSAMFKKHYSVMYHSILGLVTGSSVAIILGNVLPFFSATALEQARFSFVGALCACIGMFAAGALASYFFSRLEEKYPHDPIV